MSRGRRSAVPGVVLAMLASVAAAGPSAPPAELAPVAAAASAGDLDEAGRLAAELLARARAAGAPGRLAWAELAAGDVRFYRGDYAGALEAYGRGEALFLRAGDEFGLASARKNRGIALKNLGRAEEGVALLEDVIPTMRALGGERELASVVENAATGYLALGDTARAHDYLQQALALAERADDDVARFHALTRLAVLYLLSDAPEDALEPARAAREAAGRLGLRLDASWPETIEARSLARLGRVDEAAATLREAVRRAQALDNPSYEVGPYQAMGRVVAMRDPARALEWYARARDAAAAAGMPAPWGLERDAGVALRDLGDLDGAVERLRRAVAGLERDRGLLAADRHRAAFGDANRDVYGALVAALLDRAAEGRPGDVAAAFAVVERANARGLLEMIERARLGDDRPRDDELDRRVEALDRAIAERQSELIRPAATAARRREILAELDDLEAKWIRVAAEVRARDPRWGSLRFPEPVDAGEAAGLLAADAALVVWFRLPDALAAFVVADGRVEAVRLASDPAAVATRVEAFLDTLTVAGDEAWRPIARRLHEELVDPVLPLVPRGTRRLVVVPDDVLHFLPFEALVDGSSGDRFLLERFSVSYAPSATGLARLRDRAGAHPATGGADMLVIGDPAVPAGDAPSAGSRSPGDVEALDLRPLPYSALEARRVAGYARHPATYLGAAASEGLLRDGSLASYRVVHFATHGVVSAVRPWRSALVLTPPADGSDDGLLQVREIYGLHLASDLVVLSACRTGRGRILRGEGVEGLARAFLHAGSRAVVATVVDVPDARTATLMAAFYDRLARGESAADALRGAKLDAVAHGRPPSSWAGFVVVGDGDTRVDLRPPGRSRPVLVAGGALVALAFAVAVWRSRAAS